VPDKYYKGEIFRKRIAILGPGEFAGEMAVLDSKPRSASAEALSDLVLIEVTEELFNRYIASDKETLLEMLKVFSYRIRNDLNIMSSDLQSVSTFVHDMRNCIIPLDIAQHFMEELNKVLVGNGQEHKKRQGYEKVDKTFNNMLKAKNNLLTLIEQTLACVKKVATDYVKAEFCLLELVKETVEGISYHKNFNGKTIRVNADSELQAAYINRLDIHRVFQNLLLNAGYVSDKNSYIDVYLRDSEGTNQIIIRDYGMGIPEDIQKVLFKRNFTSKPDGNGFGLMSCREIIEDLHQGKIWFETKLGKGTDFCIALPHSQI